MTQFKKSQVNQLILSLLKERKRDRSSTDLGQFLIAAKEKHQNDDVQYIDREDVLRFFLELRQLGLGTIHRKPGRPPRFAWKYSIKSVVEAIESEDMGKLVLYTPRIRADRKLRRQTRRMVARKTPLKLVPKAEPSVVEENHKASQSATSSRELILFLRPGLVVKLPTSFNKEDIKALDAALEAVTA